MKMENTTPNKVALGWIENGTRKDAVEYAKGYATKHFEAPAISWYAVMPILGGWLFEVQEGGPGRSHLPAVSKSLSEGAELAWFRVGRRAYSVTMRDNRPFCVLLPESDSKEILTSETGKLQAKGKMDLVIKRGTTVLAVGLSIFTVGALFLVGAQAFHTISRHFVPMERIVNPSVLPHRQWSIVQSTPPNLFVESLKLAPGAAQWDSMVKPTFIAPPTDEVAPSIDGSATPVETPVIDGQPLPETVTPVTPTFDENGNLIPETVVPTSTSVDENGNIIPDALAPATPPVDENGNVLPVDVPPAAPVVDENGNVISNGQPGVDAQLLPAPIDPSAPITDINGNIVPVDGLGQPLPIAVDPALPALPEASGDPSAPVVTTPGTEVTAPIVDPANAPTAVLPPAPEETLTPPEGVPQEGI